MKFYVKTPETVTTCESYKEACGKAEELSFVYGEEVDVTDEHGIAYDLHIELEPRRVPEWLRGIHVPAMV